ncbi:MAG: hypothetical protein LUQ25_02935 [Methanoregulaceae archaeon]|nr:hypothetical protein [Methanoregulaceae archaeon]
MGYASTRPCGNLVYFLSQYLIREAETGFEVLEVELDRKKKGMMRRVVHSRVLATPGEVYVYPQRVRLHNRALLVRLAQESGVRCTIFRGLDEHLTFVCDPDLSGFLTIPVYDVIPPRPSLSATIRELEEMGLFGDLGVVFEHNLRDISQVEADVFPCRASGFSKTLDADLMIGGESLAGCLTGAQLFQECHGKKFELIDICPLSMAGGEPFIARCCRKEREGIGEYRGRFGAIVHWGASPAEIFSAVNSLVSQWRARLKSDEKEIPGKGRLN